MKSVQSCDENPVDPWSQGFKNNDHNKILNQTVLNVSTLIKQSFVIKKKPFST